MTGQPILCVICHAEIRRIQPGEGYDLREYQWDARRGRVALRHGPAGGHPPDDVDDSGGTR